MIYISFKNLLTKEWPDIYIWDKVFKSGPSKVCGRQPLKNLMGYFVPYIHTASIILHQSDIKGFCGFLHDM